MLRTFAAAIACAQVSCVVAQDVGFVFDEERNVLLAVEGGSAVDLGGLDHKVESSCSFRNRDGHHVFLPDGDGGIHHYLTDLETLLYVRKLHANPDTEICTADARGDWVYFLDPATGIWRIPADAESEPLAMPVDLFAPWGGLDPGTETIGAGIVEAADAEAAAVDAGVVDAARDRSTRDSLAELSAVVETTPVRMSGDVADDPAIFVHPSDPAKSLVLGSDKAEGLRVYGLDGRERQLLPAGRLNNVDVRTVETGDGPRAYAVASNRTNRTLDLFEIDIATGRVAAAASWPVDLDDPYGICVSKLGPFEVFVGGTDGRVQRWLIEPYAARIDAALRDEFVFGSQTEGCAVDARSGTLYVGEEDVGVWKVPLDAPGDRALLIGASAGGLVPDVEGIAIVDSRDGEQWLVVSSQGDDSFVLYDLAAERIRLRFRIGMNFASRIDGASETDGLDVTTAALPGFPEGLLVVQDGRNVAPVEAQNFKLVDWGAVEAMVR